MTVCRGIRGAPIAEENTAGAIHAATRELLDGLIGANDITYDFLNHILDRDDSRSAAIFIDDDGGLTW